LSHDAVIHGHDGISLAYTEKYNDESRVGILLLHGLAEHTGRYKELIDRLYHEKVSFFAFDLRGHGESHGKRGDVKDFAIFIKDVECVVTVIRKRFPQLKLAILGHSLGGLIATVYAATSTAIDYLVLSNPLLMPPRKAWFLRFIPYKVLSFLRVKKRHSESPEMLAYSYSDPLSTNYLTIRLMGVIFHQGMKCVAKSLMNVEQPTLILTGEQDPLIESAEINNMINKFGSVDKHLRTYKDVKHRLFQSDNKDTIINDMVAWLNERL
jgi:alpha-beta hydrolase superfamily lysophospholipase